MNVRLQAARVPRTPHPDRILRPRHDCGGLERVISYQRRVISDEEAEESRSLRSAARRAVNRRGGKNRAAPVGMTGFGTVCFGVAYMSELKLRPPKEERGESACFLRPFF